MPRVQSNDAEVPATARLRRRTLYRLRRRVYGELPLSFEEAGSDDGQVQQIEKEKAEWIGKATQLQDMLVRSRTDLDNFRRRTQKEREEMRSNVTADLLTGFLPVLDHFDLAVQAAESSSDPKAVLEGVVMIQRELVGLLQSLGLDRIEDKEKTFNPNIHEAVATESDSEKEDQAVIEVLRPGWRYGDRCLRAAMVKVNRVETAS